MGRHFFAGGLMPSEKLLRRFDHDLHVKRQWWWDGRHYQRTSEAWLRRLDENRDGVLVCFRRDYGSAEANRWLHRWRMFLLACAELFGFDHGQQ
jgi:cyclopropane-fatty-acyl-phospholipid synthase